MFSGKTKQITEFASQNYNKKNCIYLCLTDEALRNENTLYSVIMKHPNSLHCILLDEFQFFEQSREDEIYNFLKKISFCHVLIALLDMDFLARKFQVFTSLYKLYTHDSSASLEHLKGKCNYCSHDSLYSSRITPKTERIVLEKDNYVPTCEYCFRKNLEIQEKNRESAYLTSSTKFETAL